VLSHLRREMRAPKMGHPFFVLLLREKQILPLRFTQGQDDNFGRIGLLLGLTR
jgi:hypothetical protein